MLIVCTDRWQKLRGKGNSCRGKFHSRRLTEQPVVRCVHQRAVQEPVAVGKGGRGGPPSARGAPFGPAARALRGGAAADVLCGVAEPRRTGSN